jgi:hypothetical protein
MNFISFEITEICTATIEATQLVFLAVDVHVRPFLACMTSAPGAALQPATKVPSNGAFHAAGAALHPATKVLP